MFRSIIYGFLAGFGLLLLYVVSMSWLSGTEAAVSQFRALWWLYLPLAGGFGIQVGLFSRLQDLSKKQAKKIVAASGSSAGIGMLVCCAHHLAEILPLLGLSGISIILAAYQLPILLISFAINLFGIFYMANHLHSIAYANNHDFS